MRHISPCSSFERIGQSGLFSTISAQHHRLRPQARWLQSSLQTKIVQGCGTSFVARLTSAKPSLLNANLSWDSVPLYLAKEDELAFIRRGVVADHPPATLQSRNGAHISIRDARNSYNPEQYQSVPTHVAELCTAFRSERENTAWRVWERIEQGELPSPAAADYTRDFWDPLLAHCFKNGHLTGRIDKYVTAQAEVTKEKWSGVFAAFVANAIRLGTPSGDVRRLAWKLLILRIRPDDLGDIVESAVASSDGLQSLRQIYELQPLRNIYQQLIPILCKSGRFLEALSWHNYLLDHRDRPNAVDKFAALRMYVYETQMAPDLKNFDDKLQACGISVSELDQPQYDDYNESASRLEDESLTPAGNDRSRSRPLSDGFAARLFATNSVPLEYGVRTVAVFGLDELGPQATRELALRCNSAEELNFWLRDLRQRGVRLGSSVFTKLMQCIADTRDETMFANIAACDWHTDVFEDRITLDRLFRWYMSQGDSAQALRAVTVLSRFHWPAWKTPWAPVLQSLAQLRNFEELDQLVDELCSIGAALPASDHLRAVLCMDNNGSQKSHDKTKSVQDTPQWLRTATILFSKFSKTGYHVPDRVWEVLYLGFRGKECLKDLGRLCMVLLEKDLQTAALESYKTSQQASSPGFEQSLSTVLILGRQKDLVHWSFRQLSRAGHNYSWKSLIDVCQDQDTLAMPQSLPEWLRGIYYLAYLRGRGFPVATEAIRHQCLDELRKFSEKSSNLQQKRKRRHAWRPPRLASLAAAINAVWRETAGEDLLAANVLEDRGEEEAETYSAHRFT